MSQVDASDLPFRAMCMANGATATYTQMYIPEKLFNDVQYRERALKDLEYERDFFNPATKPPTMVQLGGRDIEELVRAAKLFEPLCQGIGTFD